MICRGHALAEELARRLGMCCILLVKVDSDYMLLLSLYAPVHLSARLKHDTRELSALF